MKIECTYCGWGLSEEGHETDEDNDPICGVCLKRKERGELGPKQLPAYYHPSTPPPKKKTPPPADLEPASESAPNEGALVDDPPPYQLTEAQTLYLLESIMSMAFVVKKFGQMNRHSIRMALKSLATSTHLEQLIKEGKYLNEFDGRNR